jgi:hypothetical protein
MRSLSSVLVNPYQAGEAYRSFPIATAVNTDWRDAASMPCARKVRRANSVCWHAASLAATCLRMLKLLESITPSISALSSRTMPSGGDGGMTWTHFLQDFLKMISTDFVWFNCWRLFAAAHASTFFSSSSRVLILSDYEVSVISKLDQHVPIVDRSEVAGVDKKSGWPKRWALDDWSADVSKRWRHALELGAVRVPVEEVDQPVINRVGKVQQGQFLQERAVSHGIESLAEVEGIYGDEGIGVEEGGDCVEQRDYGGICGSSRTEDKLVCKVKGWRRERECWIYVLPDYESFQHSSEHWRDGDNKQVP